MQKDFEESIVKEAKKEARKKVSRAKKEAEQLIEEEEKRWKEEMKKELKEVRERMEEKKRERLAWARLEGKRKVEEAKEEVAERVFEELVERFKEFKKTKAYADFLHRLYNKALQEIGSKEVIIHVAKEDGKFIPKAKEDLPSIGGLVVESKDGKVKVDYSFEALLDMKREDLRRVIYAELFP